MASTSRVSRGRGSPMAGPSSTATSTARGRRRSSPIAGPSTTPNRRDGGDRSRSPQVVNPERNGEDVDVDGGGGGNGNAAVGVRRWDRVYPKSDDEPTFSWRLSGNTISGFTEMCGWTLQIPLKFANINPTTRFKEMAADGRGNILEAAERLMNRCITLCEMTDMIGAGTQNFTPVYVQVVAKMKSSVILSAKKLLIIPLLVVADQSGYCVVCSFNEGFDTVYQPVNVGDFLLITSSAPQYCRRIYHRGLFAENMFLDMELKIQYSSVRSHYHRKFNPFRLSEFQLPEALYDHSCQLKLPSELENETQNSVPFVTPILTEQYFDLIGVISYVSRIERHRVQSNDEVECRDRVGSGIKLRPFKRYMAYRWIHVIDKTSKPFPVKIANVPLDCHDELIPGAIIIITHCQMNQYGSMFLDRSVSSSLFSELYLGERVQKYYMLHAPSFFTPSAKEFISRANYIDIISRADCSWSIGGMPTLKIVSDEGFSTHFESVHPILEHPKLVRRESHLQCFRGSILRAFKVETENFPTMCYIHSRYREVLQKKSEYKELKNIFPYPLFINLTWYSFIRKLPPIGRDVFRLQRCRDMVKKITESFKEYCDPYLMPAKVDDLVLPSVAALERVDGPPYFILDIINEEERTWYRCIWKSHHCTMEEKISKLESAKGKKIICLSDAFCIEEGMESEVNLHDFVIEEE